MWGTRGKWTMLHGDVNGAPVTRRDPRSPEELGLSRPTGTRAATDCSPRIRSARRRSPRGRPRRRTTSSRRSTSDHLPPRSRDPRRHGDAGGHPEVLHLVHAMSIESYRRATARRSRRSRLGRAALALSVACHQGAASTRAAAAAAAPNTLSAAERAAGWRLLFDGRTLAGWRGLGYPGVPAGHWTVENGTIKKIANEQVAKARTASVCRGGDLMTDATFERLRAVVGLEDDAGGQQRLEVQRVGGAVGRTAVERAASGDGIGRRVALGDRLRVSDDRRRPPLRRQAADASLGRAVRHARAERRQAARAGRRVEPLDASCSSAITASTGSTG